MHNTSSMYAKAIVVVLAGITLTKRNVRRPTPPSEAATREYAPVSCRLTFFVPCAPRTQLQLVGPVKCGRANDLRSNVNGKRFVGNKSFDHPLPVKLLNDAVNPFPNTAFVFAATLWLNMRL